MVAAVYLAVAVLAGPVEQPVAGQLEHIAVLCDRGGIKTVQGAGVPRIGVALLAEVRPLGDQELVMGGAVRVMTGSAVLRGRRMLPEERSPFFRVALVALLVEGVGGYQFIRNGAVRVVAIGTFQFPFPDRVVGRLQQQCPDILVTIAAGLGFRRSGEALWMAAMDAVAIGTGKPPEFVDTPLPHDLFSLFVAAEADGISLLGRCRRLGTQRHDAANSLPSSGFDMVVTGPMACLALEPGGGGARITFYPVEAF